MPFLLFYGTGPDTNVAFTAPNRPTLAAEAKRQNPAAMRPSAGSAGRCGPQRGRTVPFAFTSFFFERPFEAASALKRPWQFGTTHGKSPVADRSFAADLPRIMRCWRSPRPTGRACGRCVPVLRATALYFLPCSVQMCIRDRSIRSSRIRR